MTEHFNQPPTPPGEKCPTCARRVPFPKKQDSPNANRFQFRVPEGDVETFRELLDAVAEHVGVKGTPHEMYKTIHLSMAIALQVPKFDIDGE